MYRDNNRRQRRVLLLATILVVLLLAVDHLSDGAIRTPVRAFGSTLWSVVHNVSMRISGSGFLATRAGLARENQSLKAQIAAMQERIVEVGARESHMRQIEESARLAAAIPGITAQIVSSSAASPYGTFSISAGASDGLERGARVLSTSGFVLGHIVDVSAHQSLVEELFASGKKIEAMIRERPFSLAGSGGGNATGELPRGTPIEKGDIVFARGDGTHAIAVVGHTEGGPSSASVKVYARTPVNLETISLVYIAQ